MKISDINGNKERIVDYGQFPNDGTGEMDINVSRRLTSNVIGGTAFSTTWLSLGIYIIGNTAKIVDKNTIGQFLWKDYFDVLPGCYQAGITQIRLTLPDGTIVIGYITINPLNPYELSIIWDPDTLPANTVIEGPARDPNSWSSIDYIIDPLRWNPNQAKNVGLRLMLLGKIGNDDNDDGADGWHGVAANHGAPRGVRRWRPRGGSRRGRLRRWHRRPRRPTPR